MLEPDYSSLYTPADRQIPHKSEPHRPKPDHLEQLKALQECQGILGGKAWAVIKWRMCCQTAGSTKLSRCTWKPRH